MGILKSVFKISSLPLIQCCKPVALLDASFVHCYSTLTRGGRGEKHKIVQVAVFRIIFVTDWLKHLTILSVAFYCCSF